MLGLALTYKVYGIWVKLTVTLFAAFMVTEHNPVPEHPAPLHPANNELAPATAVNVTTVLLSNCAPQAGPQLIPGRELATVPIPGPLVPRVRVSWPVKVAVTVLLASMISEHGPVVEQPDPLHPLNAELAPGVAVSVTTVFFSNWPLQVNPQSIPAGELVTVPEPLLATMRVGCWVKPAVTVLLETMATTQGPLPEQAPARR